MIRWFGLLRGCAIAIVIAMGAAALFGCSGNNAPEGQPSFYQDLAGPAAALDAGAAQSMISGYRRNNGLAVVTIDPELMRLANEQAIAMAARGALDHSIAAPFQQRIRKSQFDAAVAVENIGAGYHTLAEAFSGWLLTFARSIHGCLSAAQKFFSKPMPQTKSNQTQHETQPTNFNYSCHGLAAVPGAPVHLAFTGTTCPPRPARCRDPRVHVTCPSRHLSLRARPAPPQRLPR